MWRRRCCWSYWKNIVKAEQDDDYVYVYEKQAFGAAKENLIWDSENSVNLNWDFYNTYKYTFKKDGGNYYFQSLDLVNE